MATLQMLSIPALVAYVFYYLYDRYKKETLETKELKKSKKKKWRRMKKVFDFMLFFFYLSHLFSSVFIAHCSFMFLSLFLTLCLSFSSSSFFCAIRQSWLWQGTSMSDTVHLLLNLFLCENYFTHIFLVLGLLGQHNVWCNTYLVWLTESFWGVLSMPCECEKIICVMKISDRFAQKKHDIYEDYSVNVCASSALKLWSACDLIFVSSKKRKRALPSSFSLIQLLELTTVTNGTKWRQETNKKIFFWSSQY